MSKEWSEQDASVRRVDAPFASVGDWGGEILWMWIWMDGWMDGWMDFTPYSGPRISSSSDTYLPNGTRRLPAWDWVGEILWMWIWIWMDGWISHPTVALVFRRAPTRTCQTYARVNSWRAKHSTLVEGKAHLPPVWSRGGECGRGFGCEKEVRLLLVVEQGASENYKRSAAAVECV